MIRIMVKGKDLKDASENVYRATDGIVFANKYMRTNIGKAIEEI